jgi:hypothetical protein
MRVRCKAAAHALGNSVGDLEIECRGTGLLISYLGVSSYRAGYAPGFPTRGTVVHAPWQTTRAIRLGDENLLLCVDVNITPLNRFLLGNFSSAEPARSARLRRNPTAWASLALGCAAAWTALPTTALHADSLARFGSVGAALLVCGGAIARWLARRRPGSHVVLRALVSELSERLPEPVPREPPLIHARRWSLRSVGALVPRSAVGGSIALLALALAALLGGRALPTSSPRIAGSPTELPPLADNTRFGMLPNLPELASDVLPSSGAPTLRQRAQRKGSTP